jgi:hypothetical protein
MSIMIYFDPFLQLSNLNANLLDIEGLKTGFAYLSNHKRVFKANKQFNNVGHKHLNDEIFESHLNHIVKCELI